MAFSFGANINTSQIHEVAAFRVHQTLCCDQTDHLRSSDQRHPLCLQCPLLLEQSDAAISCSGCHPGVGRPSVGPVIGPLASSLITRIALEVLVASAAGPLRTVSISNHIQIRIKIKPLLHFVIFLFRNDFNARGEVDGWNFDAVFECRNFSCLDFLFCLASTKTASFSICRLFIQLFSFEISNHIFTLSHLLLRGKVSLNAFKHTLI